MNVLGIETATIAVGVGLSRDGAPVASIDIRPGRRHAETLHPALASMLSSAGIAFSDLDAIAVDVGPGLFTGLRVGIAAAKSLAYALSLPVVALRSTEVLCASQSFSPLPAIAIVDMRRGDVAFEFAGVENAVSAEASIATPETLAKHLSDLAGSYVLLGDGARRYFDVLAAGDNRFCLAGPVYDAPSAAAVAMLGEQRVRAGETLDPLAIEAVYLREADAAINFATRHEPVSL